VVPSVVAENEIKKKRKIIQKSCICSENQKIKQNEQKYGK